MRRDLPTGVVTLLFTDIEGSTRLLAELRDRYVAALAEHRRVIREAVTAHGGVEVDTQGDSFLVAFSRPTGAVSAAVAAQRALANGPVRVRMGLHTGEPEVTDEGYVGLDVHRGARIGDAGHGGQILLSAATRALVDIESTDLGEHRLDGIERPEHLYGVVADGLRLDFPPLRTAASAPALPEALTSFVGREDELARLDDLLDDPDRRIVTLIGPGGCGKTRLAVESARRRWSARGERVGFASVAAAVDEDGVVNGIAEGVGFEVDLGHGAGRRAEDQLADFLRPRPQTVIVDNFEQVVSAAPVLARLASAAPGTRFIATSRARLELQGEWVMDVGGLAQDGGSEAQDQGTDPALRLFIERARQAVPDFALSDKDWPDARRICGLVEGMPLGIELAAAWVGTFSVAELADGLTRSLDLIEARASDTPKRHRSLRAAFEGSWELLDEAQRSSFAALSVFAGGCTTQAASAVTDADPRILADLVARSLLRRTSTGRYDIHELLRQYAAEALAEAGREAEVREGHARYFTTELQASDADLHSERGPTARARLEPDSANLRLALEWAARHWPADDVDTLLGTTRAMWSNSVHPSAGEIHSAILRAAEARSPSLDATDDVPLRHLVAAHTAFALSIVGDREGSERVASEHVDVLRAAGRMEHVGLCRFAQGANHSFLGEDAEAIDRYDEAEAALGPQADRLLLADLGTFSGWSRLMLDDIDGARRDFEAAFDIASAMGEPLTLAFCQSKLALLEDQAGDYQAGLERHLEAFASFARLENQGGVGYTLSRASLSAYCVGDYQAALDLGQMAYDGFAEVNHHWGLIVTTGRLAYACLALERVDEARRWALHSLDLSRTGYRLGRLLALGAVAGAMVRSGEASAGHRLLAAIVQDPDVPSLFRMQPEAELDRAETAAGSPDGQAVDDPVDLDRVIEELLRQKHPAPAMRIA